MLVIVADADPMFRRFIAQSLAGTEFEPKLAEEGEEAWTCAHDALPPFAVVYSWGLPDIGGVEMCQRLRKLRTQRERYVIATLGPSEASSLVATIEGGADDVLVKPFSAEALLPRLRLAASRCASPERTAGTLRDALREALASKIGGEIVVRRGDRVGHVHVIDGRIAWARVSDEPVRLGELVRGAGAMFGDDDAAAVLEESGRLKVHFADVLVKWGYLDAAGARECVRALVAAQLGALLSMDDAMALFLPRARSYDSQLSFALTEVTTPTLPPPPSLRGVDSSTRKRKKLDRLARLGGCAEASAQIQGATGAAVLDRGTGVEWVGAGDGVNGEVAWSLLGTLTALGPGAEDAIAVRSGAAFFARALDDSSALVVAFALDQATLGLARSLMKQLVERWNGQADPSAGEGLAGENEGTNG